MLGHASVPSSPVLCLRLWHHKDAVQGEHASLSNSVILFVFNSSLHKRSVYTLVLQGGKKLVHTKFIFRYLKSFTFYFASIMTAFLIFPCHAIFKNVLCIISM